MKHMTFNLSMASTFYERGWILILVSTPMVSYLGGPPVQRFTRADIYSLGQRLLH